MGWNEGSKCGIMRDFVEQGPRFHILHQTPWNVLDPIPSICAAKICEDEPGENAMMMA